MTIQRHTYLKRVTFLLLAGLFLATAVVGVLPPSQTEAWTVNAPVDESGNWEGVMRLRIGKDGVTTSIPLRAYYRTQYAHPTITFTQAKRDFANEDEHSCSGTNTVDIKVNGQKWDCDESNRSSYPGHTVTLPKPKSIPELGDGKWFVSDATIQFVGNLNPSCKKNKNSNGEKNDADKGCVDYKFTAHLNNGSNSRLGMLKSTNANGYTLWGNDSYTIPFGPELSHCGQPKVPGKIGLVDPDSDNIDVKLQQRDGSSWKTLKSYTPSHGSGTWSTSYQKFVPGERYRLRITGVNTGNTVVALFPFATIYGEIGLSCPIQLTTTATTKNADGSAGTNTVEVNPSLPGSSQGNGKIKWTHTAYNPGAKVTTTLSYTSTTTNGVPAAPAPANHSVTLEKGDKDIKSINFTVPKNTPAGTKYCQQITSSKTTTGNNTPIHSTKACVTVKVAPLKPYFAVYGSDVVAGRTPGTCVADSNPQKVRGWNHDATGYFSGGDYAGAGAQAAVFATGNISHFSSGLNITGLKPTGLSFSNFGTDAHAIYGGSFQSTPPAGCDVDSGTPTVTYDDPSTPNVTIPTTSIPTNHDVYIKVVNKDVYIGGNISYASTSWGTLNKIPSFKLVVEGGSIFIDKSVSRLDGMYVAIPKADGTKGAISTCTTGFSRVSRTSTSPTFLDACDDQQLKVYGSFMADNIWFDRSRGTIDAIIVGDSASQKDQSAELFTYGPEMWLPNGSGSTAIEILSYQGLPPVL